MGKLWNIIEEWRAGLEFPPSPRQVAIRLGVSQSSFDTWRNPVQLPRTFNLLAVARLTGKPYKVVVQAAIDDIKLFDESAAEKALKEALAKKRRTLTVVTDAQAIKPRRPKAVKPQPLPPEESD